MFKAFIKHKKEDGQTIFEFVFFLPIILILIAFVLKLGNAINGSINQQKATRGYFYSRIKHNSTLPLHSANGPHLEWSQFGMFFVGWKEKFDQGTFPVQPCYKVSLPFVDSTENSSACDSYTGETTNFIRVGTVYGLCGATYFNEGGWVFKVQALAGNGSFNASDVAVADSCVIKPR
jgi:hypothetical protein